MFTRGWKPALVGSVLGLILGFAGGAGAGLVDEIGPGVVADAAVSLSPSASSTAAVAAEAYAPAAASAGAGRSADVKRSLLAGPARRSAICGRPGGRLVRFRVGLESGLATSPAQFVKDLMSVLCDGRSWIGSGRVRFRYDPAGSLLVGLRSPASTEKRCRQLVGLSVGSYYSCGSRSEVVLNSDRWFTGSKFWPGPVPVYRQMLVNHEIGHALGQHHRTCPRDGAWAPVMMQQSKGLATGSNTCQPNVWPLSYEVSSLRP
jgi:Protein of unknown function (DUF3152)